MGGIALDRVSKRFGLVEVIRDLSLTIAGANLACFRALRVPASASGSNWPSCISGSTSASAT